ncbi:hypothetical protein ABFX02_04G188100 [Erythranthe guttata]
MTIVPSNPYRLFISATKPTSRTLLKCIVSSFRHIAVPLASVQLSTNDLSPSGGEGGPRSTAMMNSWNTFSASMAAICRRSFLRRH